ncbi:uncharacterized protein LOC112044328 [Bicyclus anynana]|uniref:Luciferin 4-monooxygenase n=1 Tax=Bicyclus anynana TaxID=110368 RepID=A0A6J1MKA1_BICAN|nr:uncharacterized protein LOC112044328 [Bicyclus anynana]XP_023935915.2 uncharacterized protein LOC112044328 [Bicyclus anynana]
MATVHNNVVSGPEERSIPAHLSYGQFLFDKLKAGGNNIAQICAETGNSVTYRSILQSSVNLAAALQRLGLKKGDVVSLSSENRFEFTVSALAIVYCGGVLSTLNVTYSPGEITHILNITKPKFIFTSPITAQNIYDCSKDLAHVEKLILFGEYDIVPGVFYNDLVKNEVPIDDFTLVDVNGLEDTLAVMCSSGTTGLPKGVMLTHVNFLTLAVHMKYYLETSQQNHKHKVTRALSLIPWFHAYGFITTLAIMCMHIEIVFLVRFEEEQFLETIQKYKINMATLVPPLAVFLAKHPLVPRYDLSSLNEVWCGAAPLSREIQAAVSQRSGIGFIRQGYGLTEVTMACCVDLTNSGQKQGSCGIPAPGMKIKVLDIDNGKKLGPNQEGELWIKSPLRMKGYMGDRAASDALFDAEGYVQTGDIGYYDSDGFFYIVDRLKELIKYKGFQVAPAELEALVLQLAGVAECGVVGRSDELAGELPVAFVVPQPGRSLTAQQIQDYVASKVSPAKHLRGGVIFVDEIPKNPSGKILRKELRKMLDDKVKSKL